MENILTLKKPSTFANLLMEKPGSSVDIAKKVRITPEEQRNFLEKYLRLYLEFDSGTVLSFC